MRSFSFSSSRRAAAALFGENALCLLLSSSLFLERARKGPFPRAYEREQKPRFPRANKKNADFSFYSHFFLFLLSLFFVMKNGW
jgi:stalled ribosome alternative rescue factor ArfA